MEHAARKEVESEATEPETSTSNDAQDANDDANGHDPTTAVSRERCDDDHAYDETIPPADEKKECGPIRESNPQGVATKIGWGKIWAQPSW